MAEDRHHTMRYRFAAQYTAGKRVLDMACGDGKGGAFLLNCASYLGVDSDRERIEVCCPSVCPRDDFRYLVADCCASGLPAESFDVIVGLETYEHLPPERQPDYLSELARLLAPGGMVLLSCPPAVAGLGPWFREHIGEPRYDEFRAAVEAKWPGGEWYHSFADRQDDFSFKPGECPDWTLDADTTYTNSEGNPARMVVLYVGRRA